MKKFLEKIFPPTHKKKYSTWQIELTTRCPLKCKMCVRDGRNQWLNADISLKNFKKITPYLKDVERVILEGWGETLLNKNLIEIIRLIKKEGSEVGFVTSGMGLKEKKILELLNAGIDFMGFSISGSLHKTHNKIRINSNLDTLLSNIKLLNQIKKEKNLTKPNLHVVYLMLKSNIHEVIKFIETSKDLNITNVILINIIHISNIFQERLKVFSCNEKNDFSEIVEKAKKRARDLNINLKTPAMTPIEVTVCEENPLRNLYISVEGEVSPCVYLNPPIPSPFKRIYCGTKYKTNSLSFGNIFKENFPDIWKKEEYINFRDKFLKRKRQREFSPLTIGLDTFKKRESEALSDSPKFCATCHKMLGV